jgi:hypothetical protein
MRKLSDVGIDANILLCAAILHSQRYYWEVVWPSHVV